MAGSSRLFIPSEPEVSVLLGTCEQMVLVKDERTITKKEPGDRLYIVQNGSVRVTVDKNRREVYTCTHGAGEVFG